jgi:hypothetical protein
MRQDEAQALLGIGHGAPSLTAADLRRHYLRAALSLHPDKNREDEQAGQRFAQLKEAYDLLLGVRHDQEVVRCESVRTSSMLEILTRALSGKDVEAELRRLGVHRPSPLFGIDLTVPFDRGGGGTQGISPESLQQAFADAFHDSGLDYEGNPLEGWARSPAGDDEGGCF